jgi:hypothetical protein
MPEVPACAAQVMSQKPGKRANSSGPTGASPGEFRRLYRGLTNPYDPDRVRRDCASGIDFTNCPASSLRAEEARREDGAPVRHAGRVVAEP